MTSLKGRVAIVTGAGRGMGRAVAIKLAEAGADVALLDLEAPVESAELAGPSAIPFAADASSDAEWKRLGEAINREFGRADILVNNAATLPRGSIEDMDFAT